MTDQAPDEPSAGGRSCSEEGSALPDPTVPAGGDRRVLRFSSLRPGALFAGRYEIRRHLGTGGAGEVHEAEDRVAGETVALKVLFPHLGEDDALERLRRELHAVRHLHHPGIVHVHDIGQHDGLLFLVMERLHGETLAERLRKRGGPLAPREIRRILRGILDALAAAHREGVLHRDVKPANVFLARNEDGEERVVLLDFGLARAPGDLALTATGQFLGTPRYASPEQARGEKVLSPASDLWSVGILLWEMAAGEAPWKEEGTVSLFSAQAKGELPKAPAALRDLPRDLRRLLDWLLGPDPRDRPRDAGEALAALEEGRGASLARRLRRAWRAGGRKRAAIVAATAATLLLAAFVLFFPWRLEARRGETILRARSLAGIAVRSWRAPAPLSGQALPFPPERPWTRTWYVGLLNDTRGNCRRPFPPEAPLGALGVDILGDIAPLEVRREVADAFAGGVHGAAPGYDGIVGTPQLLAPRGLRGYGTVPLLAIAWAHQGHSPSVLALVDPTEQAPYRREQRYWYLLDCPGRLVMPPVTVTTGPERATHRLLVLSADQPLLDGRQAVVSVDPVLTSGRAALSPFSTGQPADGRPTWTTFTSLHESGRLFASGPGRVELRVKDRAGPLVLDARTGVPVRPGDRGGLPEDTWREGQARLLALLEQVSVARDLGTGRRLAARFEEFGREGGADPTQRGVALGRAAMLRMEAGDLADALADTRQAIRLEPGLPGHWKRLLDILARTGEWERVRHEVLEDTFPLHRDLSFSRDLLLAGMLTGHGAEARRLFTRWRDEGVGVGHYYGAYDEALWQLHLGVGPGISRALENYRCWRTWPEFAYLGALGALLDDPPRPQETLDLLAPHEDGFGAGHAVPVVPLRALAARLAGEQPLTDAEIEADVEHVEDAARTDLVSLYFLPWAHALAAASVEDPALARRHEARLRELRGTGPWTPRVLAPRDRAPR